MVRGGSIQLPRFQRGEEWEIGHVERLMTSMVQNLPIGAFLVLEIGGDPPFQSRPLHTVTRGGERIIELLLDGQQRLTALWRALHDNYPGFNLLVDLEREEEEGLTVVAQRRWQRDDRQFPLWVDIPKECLERGKIPFTLVNPLLSDGIKAWALRAEDGDLERAWRLSDRINELKGKIENFMIPALVLGAETSPHLAIRVFIQMNTNYVRLTAFDIVVAQVEQAIGESLADRVHALQRDFLLLPDLAEPGDLVLGILALLKDQPPNERGFLSLAKIGFEHFDEEWQKVCRGTAELLTFMQAEGVIHSQVLPTESVLAALAAVWAEAPQHSDAAGRVRTLMRRYLWYASFSPRYDRAVPTRVLEDYRALRRAVLEGGAPEEVPCLQEELPSQEEIAETPWPRRKHRLARAILCLGLRGGAIDIADGAPLTSMNLRQREYHHVFPRNWLESKGFDVGEADRAVNCIVITWKTNREISAKEPLVYLRERVEGASLGEAEIRGRLRAHGVDYEVVARNDYPEFVQQRAFYCQQAMEALCRGEDWRP
jgi:hypothetical protein